MLTSVGKYRNLYLIKLVLKMNLAIFKGMNSIVP